MNDYHLAPDEERDAYINDADSGMPADDSTNEEPLDRTESAAQFFDDLIKKQDRYWEEERQLWAKHHPTNEEPHD